MIDSISSISQLQKRLELLMRQLRELSILRSTGEEQGYWRPSVDVIEGAKEVLIVVEVPGVSAADVHAEISDGVLSVYGCKRAPTVADEEGIFVCVERRYGRFRCGVQLDGDLDPLSGSAVLAEGELTITFTKTIDHRGKTIRLEIHEQ